MSTRGLSSFFCLAICKKVAARIGNSEESDQTEFAHSADQNQTAPYSDC